jgi:hypothetical protein
MLGDLLFTALLRIRDAIADLFGLGRYVFGDWWDWRGRALVGTFIVLGTIAGLMARHTDSHDPATHTAPTIVVTSTTHAH